MHDFKLNFMGLSVADLDRSITFYGDTMGIEIVKKIKGLARFIDWIDVFVGESGMILEIFGDGLPEPAIRSWGKSQAFRPSLHVVDLEGTVAELRRRGVNFVGEIEETVWGRRIEFVAPEGIRWTLGHAPGFPASDDLSKPRLGCIEIKARDLAGQKRFYKELLGMRIAQENDSWAMLEQGTGEPFVFIEEGGESYDLPDPDRPQGSDENHPIFISFQTADIEAAARHLAAHNVPVIQEVTVQRWGGTDTLVGDADGNVIQVIEMHLRGSYKKALDALAGS